MSYYNNPVDTPEEYGFDRVVGWLSLEDEPYQFYYLAVLQNERGYYLGTDSGCSCPTPWESHTADDFTGPLTAEQAREEIQSLANPAAEDPAELLALIV